jgi:hypothetical protein
MNFGSSNAHGNRNNNIMAIIIDFFFLIHSFRKADVESSELSVKRLSGNANYRKITKIQVRVSDEGVSLLRNQNNHAPACQQKINE